MTTGWNIGGEGGNSFPFDKIGDYVQGTILDLAEVQQTDMNTNQPAFWDDGKPKMMYRVTLQTELRNPADPSDNGQRSVFLRGSKKVESQSSLAATLAAVKQAQGNAELKYGAKLTLQYIGDGEPSQRGRNAPKLYAAWYEPPAMVLEQPPEHRTPSMPPAVGQQAFQSPGAPPGWTQEPQQQVQQPPAPPVQQQVPQQGPPVNVPPPGITPPMQQQAQPPIQQQWAQQYAGGQMPQQPPMQQQAPPPAAPPNQLAGVAGQPITPEQVAGIQALGQDPATVYGPDWQSRVVA